MWGNNFGCVDDDRSFGIVRGSTMMMVRIDIFCERNHDALRVPCGPRGLLVYNICKNGPNRVTVSGSAHAHARSEEARPCWMCERASVNSAEWMPQC